MSQPRRFRIVPSLVAAVVLTLFLVVLAQGDATTRYVAADGTPLAPEPGGEPVANLYITTEVEVLEQDGEASHVRVHGFMQSSDGEVAEVFTDDANATRVADVDDASALQTTPSDGDWSEVVLEGWVPSDSLADSVEPMFEEAAEIYAANCTRCHAGYAAPVDVLRSTLPNTRVERIVHSMARGTDVTDDQVNLIVQWFQKHPDDLDGL